jgi:hypothetical protein
MFDLRRNVCYDKATVVMDAVWSGRVYSDMVQETRSNVGMVTLRCLRSIFWAVAVTSSHKNGQQARRMEICRRSSHCLEST